jgi:hypothetical protein
MEHPICKDVTKIIKEFSTKDTLDFNEFKEIWVHHKAYYLHCICKETLKRNYFLELMFFTVTDIATNEQEDMGMRVGSIYMWYCLFMTQPQPNTVRIRLTLMDWDKIESFHSSLREFKCYDGDFVLCKLKCLSAFFICAHRQKLCLGQQSDAMNKQLTMLGDQRLVSRESDIMKQLSKCQQMLKNYSSMKEDLSDHLPSHLISSSSDIDRLLSEERMDELKVTEQVTAGAVGDEADRIDEGGEGEEPGTSKRHWVASKAYKSKPKLISKRRSKNSK